MAEYDKLQPSGEKLKRVILWISEMVQQFPHKKRKDLLKEAQIRFDLTPRECEFLDTRLSSEDATD